MSRKIYNKIILRWNEASHQYETAYEDSYQYDGPVDECLGFDDLDMDDLEDELTETWSKVATDLGKKVQKALKKSMAVGASQFDKTMAGSVGNLGKYLEHAVSSGAISKAFAKFFPSKCASGP